MTTVQWAHQRKEYIDHMYSEGRALLWQMRTGKTKAVIDNACALALGGHIDRVLVIAPNSVHANWAYRELPKHHWDNVFWKGFVWNNSDKDNDVKFDLYMKPEKALAWLFVNMESLIIDRIQNAIMRFIRKANVMTVFDESHHFAVPGAKRTAVARAIARRCKYKRILTGTPVENSPLQAFSQYELLEKGALGHETYGSFKDEFAEFRLAGRPGNRRYPQLVKYKNIDVLKERMAPYTSVVLRADCEDLPPVMVDERRIELPDELKAQWKLCKANDLQFLEDKGLQSTITGGAALIKLQQI